MEKEEAAMTCTTNSPEETEALGASLAQELSRGRSWPSPETWERERRPLSGDWPEGWAAPGG